MISPPPFCSSNPKGNLAIETSHCKLFGTTRAWETLYDAFQVAGGSGYIATNPYEKRLRDFRVATVFEGTTEIHSIYPALSALRSLDKQVKELAEKKSSRLRFFLANWFRRVEWPLEFKDRTLQRASRLARSERQHDQEDAAAGIDYLSEESAGETIPPASHHDPEPLSFRTSRRPGQARA